LPTLRVVLDTNVLASGIAYGDSVPGRVVGAWDKGSIKVVLSHHILGELARILPRFDHKLHWTSSKYANLIDILTMRAELVDPEALDPKTVRDPGDIPVLGTLLASGADYLITGDKDLLALAERYPAIISPADFWRRHGA
jgi:putative PIN family toxin of toxin-antitoxin system